MSKPDKQLEQAIAILDRSISKIRAAALDVRELPDKVGYADPAVSANQLDREADNLERARDIITDVTGRGTGVPDPQ